MDPLNYKYFSPTRIIDIYNESLPTNGLIGRTRTIKILSSYDTEIEIGIKHIDSNDRIFLSNINNPDNNKQFIAILVMTNLNITFSYGDDYGEGLIQYYVLVNEDESLFAESLFERIDRGPCCSGSSGFYMIDKLEKDSDTDHDVRKFIKENLSNFLGL